MSAEVIYGIDFRVGKYKADYSRLTPGQIAQEDAELVELYANSRPTAPSEMNPKEPA